MTLGDHCDYIIDLIDKVLDTTSISSPQDAISKERTGIDHRVVSDSIAEPVRT
jgi:hypothetical protein